MTDVDRQIDHALVTIVPLEVLHHQQGGRVSIGLEIDLHPFT